MGTRKPVYILGAGMAGLAAAIRAANIGLRPRLFEATGHAGGRCRSYFEPGLGRTVDNGTHLLLGGNSSLFNYLREASAPADALLPMDPVQFPFFDIAENKRWTLRPTAGRIPWWLLLPNRHVPGARFSDYVSMWRLTRLGPDSPDAPLTDFINTGHPMFKRFWQPLARAVVNTEAEEASAVLIGRMLAETFVKGAEASRPYLATGGLSRSLVEPALAWLEESGWPATLGKRIKALTFGEGGRVRSLETDSGALPLEEGAAVICALPPGEAKRLLPELEVPNQFNAIVNIHYASEPSAAPAKFFGLIGAPGHWVFTRNGVISVTISTAGSLTDEPAARIAPAIWTNVAAALGRKGDPLPPYHVIKEKRATIAQTPAQNARRPTAQTRHDNLFLAGDWTKTGLPATIEGAVRSGQEAAALALEFVTSTTQTA
ncbi:MAG: hydroxysqualene dehydroxylase HpnE [Pseudomonadota bacterium]|nr:hydroxysqualene dehydroxylase HpnE [Pseudomonadota bacterium]